jgi:hypothetical protein
MILFKMKKIKYKEKNECPICLQKIKYKIKTGCNHNFCDICIVRHLMLKETCPICRRDCDCEHITNQISVKRRRFLMRKLIQPVKTDNVPINTNTEPLQQMNIYSHFIPHYIPASITTISIFIIQVYVIIYLVIFITQTVRNMI